VLVGGASSLRRRILQTSRPPPLHQYAICTHTEVAWRPNIHQCGLGPRRTKANQRTGHPCAPHTRRLPATHCQAGLPQQNSIKYFPCWELKRKHHNFVFRKQNPEARSAPRKYAEAPKCGLADHQNMCIKNAIVVTAAPITPIKCSGKRRPHAFSAAPRTSKARSC
jgi:hypothetical protein